MKGNRFSGVVNQRQRFSLRKYRAGLASVLLGTVLFAVQTTQADELGVTSSASSQVTTVLEGSPLVIVDDEATLGSTQSLFTEESSENETIPEESKEGAELRISNTDTVESSVAEVHLEEAAKPENSDADSLPHNEKTVQLFSSPAREEDVPTPVIATRSAVSESSESTTDENEVETENQARIKYYQELRDLKLKRIEIPYGFTRIDDGAFTDADWVEEVVIPETVEQIGNHAFKGTSLKKIELPKGLKYLGHESFSNIQTLEEAFLPNTLVEDYNYYWNYYSNGSNAFANNTNLKKLTIEPGLTFIPAGLASGTGLTTLDIPNSVVIIRQDAFANAEKLSEVNLPAGLTEIHHGAFQNTAITNITLPKPLTNIGSSSFANTPLTAIDLPEGLKSIDSGAFSGTKLEEITLPKSINSISTGFNGISSLKKIVVQSDIGPSNAWATSHFHGSPLTTVTLAEGVTSLPGYIFAHQENLTTIILPSSLREIGESAFAQSGLKAVVLPEGLTEVGSEAFAGIENLTTVSIPASLERADSAFRDSSNLKTVNFAPGTRKIADGLLSGTAFEEFTIPEGIEELGNRAFANNQRLTKVTLPSTLRHFGEAVFADTSLKTIIFPRNMTTIPRGILANTAVEQIVIPEGVVEIEDRAFENIPSLKSVILPSSLKKIGGAAFYNTGLERIQLPEGLTEIGHSAFSATKLREVHLPNSVEVIGHSAFSNNSELTAVTLSTTLKEISSYAFSGTRITQIDIPASVTKVGDYAFSGVYNLEEVDFSTGLKEIGSYAFSGTSLRDIKLPSGLETIGGEAFAIETLSSIFIPKSLREGGITYYNRGALGGAPGSVKVSFESGTERIADHLFAGSNLKTLVLPSTIREIGLGAFAYSDLSKISLPESLRVIGDSAFAGTHLTEVNLPSQLTEIGSYAFSGSELTEITLPDSVVTVGHHAFSNTYQLKQAKLSENLAVISDSLFANSALENMSIPEKVSEIGDSAFYSTKLKSVLILASVVNIGSSAFSNTPLSSLTLTDGLVEIGREAFTQTNLGELVLPDTVTTLGARAFASAGITKLTLSKNLVHANYNSHYYHEVGAFANNPDLTEVHIPKALENGWYMFAGNRKLSKVTFEDGRTEIPAGLLAETGLIELTLPETIERIGGNAFASNPQLTTWKPHVGLKEIGSYAFSNSGLKELSLPDGLTYLGDYAFADSSKLNHLTINKSLETISTAAFSGASINRLNIPSNIKAIYDSAFQRNDLKELIFEEGVEDIARSAFADNDLTKLTLPDSLKALGSGAFANNYKLGVLYLGTGLQENHRYGYSYDYSPFKQDEDGTFRQPSNLFVTVKEGTTHIPAGLFKNAEQVIYVKIPDTVTSVGASAFEGTSLGANFDRKTEVVDKPLDPDNLLTVTLPDSITHLGESAFGNIKTLTNINIPKELVEADMAFKDSRALVRLRSEIPGTRIPDGILQETGVNTFIVPPTVTEIGKYAFLGNREKLSESGLSSINKGLENIIFSPGLKKIDTRALENTSVTFLDIPNGVTEIKEGAFRFNEKLVSVKLPKELTRLEGYLFEGNALMTKVIVPSKVEHVDVNAFVNMPNLEVVYLPSSVRHIDDNLVFNPEKTIFHVEAGSYAETYMREKGLEYQVVSASDYAHYNDGIVIEDKTRFVTTSQALKHSGYLALELDYELDTTNRVISDKEIRITLPKGHVNFGKQGLPSSARIEDNILIFSTVKDSGRLRFYVETDDEELVRLNIGAQIIYKEYGIQKSETLDVISEDMPFLTISTSSTISDKKITVSGRTVPNSRVRFAMVDPVTTGKMSYDRSTEGLYPDLTKVEVISKADGSYHAELPIDFVGGWQMEFQNGNTFKIRAIAEIDGIKVQKDSEIITYQDNLPRLVSFKMKHNGVTIDLSDGQPHETIVFRPGQEFEFEVSLDNDTDVSYLSLITNRKGKESKLTLTKIIDEENLDATSHLYKFKGFFDESSQFVPGDLMIRVIPKEEEKEEEKRNKEKLKSYLETLQLILGEYNPRTELGFPEGKEINIVDAFLKLYSQGDTELFNILNNVFTGVMPLDELEKLNYFWGTDLSGEQLLKGKGSIGILTLPDKLVKSFAEIVDKAAFEHFMLSGGRFPKLFDDLNIVEEFKLNNEQYKQFKKYRIESSLSNFAEGTNFEKFKKIFEKYDKILEPLSVVNDALDVINVGKQVFDFLLVEAIYIDFMISGRKFGLIDDSLNSLKEIHDNVYIPTSAINVSYDGVSLVPGPTAVLANLTKLGYDSTIWLLNWGETIYKGRKLKYYEKKPAFDEMRIAAFEVMLKNYFFDIRSKYMSKFGYYGYERQFNQSGLKEFTIPLESVTYVIDPSGTVLNAITNKPVVGATASVYYRNEAGEEVLWAAGDYSQLNPILTTVNGEYAWDVPEGWWKVRITKDGYETQESAWLPVPPPQTEVNFKLEPKTYQLNFELSGGKLVSALPLTYKTEVEQELPLVEREGYTFEGWVENSDLTGAVYRNTLFDKVGDKKLWAKWAKIKVITTRTFEDRRVLKTDEVVYLDDSSLLVGQTREEASVDGYVLVEVTEILEDGVVVSRTEHELSRENAQARKVYRGTKPLPVDKVVTTRTFEDRRVLKTDEVVYLGDASLLVGQSREESGVDGYLLVEVTETFEDGVVVSRTERELSRQEAQPRKVYRGTKPLPVDKVVTTRTFEERRPVTTDEVVYFDDSSLLVGQTREETSVDGYVLVEVTETLEDGVVVSRTEHELSRENAQARKVYQGTKPAPEQVEKPSQDQTLPSPAATATSPVLVDSQKATLPKTGDKKVTGVVGLGLLLSMLSLTALVKSKRP